MEFDPSTNVVWKCAVPAGNSPPCIVGTRIFPTAYEEHVLQTICIEHRDGSVMWQRSVEPIQTERSHRINGLASPAPARLEPQRVTYAAVSRDLTTDNHPDFHDNVPLVR